MLGQAWQGQKRMIRVRLMCTTSLASALSLMAFAAAAQGTMVVGLSLPGAPSAVTTETRINVQALDGEFSREVTVTNIRTFSAHKDVAMASGTVSSPNVAATSPIARDLDVPLSERRLGVNNFGEGSRN
jgi:hypothetical protein